MITIYIVDDEPMAIQYLQYLLSRSGAACRVAGSSTNSRHALKEILSTKPDVVFTDISMPVMDGLELARRVLEQQAARVYLLTSYADFEYAKQGVKIGVRDYILKNELSEALLKSLLERAEAELAGERRARRLVLERGVRDFLLDDAAPAPELPPLPDAEGGYALMLLCAPVSIPMARREAAEPAPPDAGALLWLLPGAALGSLAAMSPRLTSSASRGADALLKLSLFTSLLNIAAAAI